MSRFIRNSILALGLAAGISASAAQAQYLPTPYGLPVMPYRYFYSQFNVSNMGADYSLYYYRTAPFTYSYSYSPWLIPNPIYEGQAKAMREARKQTVTSDTKNNATGTTTTTTTTTQILQAAQQSRDGTFIQQVDLQTERLTSESFNGLPTAFKTAIISPKPDDIASGKALNDILTTTIDLEKKFGRNVGAFIAPEVMTSIRFAGNAQADLSNWVRQGEIEFPNVFQSSDYATPRAWLKNDFGIIVTNLTAGKTPDSSLYQALVTSGRTIRRTFDERKGALSPDDRKAGEQFLVRYDAVANILRTPNTAELCSTEYATMGVGTVDLIEYMAKFKLQFGAAPRGQDSSYEMLHKALSTYAMSLADQRR